MIKQTILLGDSVDLMSKMQTESVDLIIADPPYNLSKDYGNNIDKRGFDEYLLFSKKWLEEACRLLKPTGSIYVFMGFRFISYLYTILEKDLGMQFNSWIVWHYTQGIGKTKGFSPRHDDILMFNKSDKFVFNLDAVRVPQKYYRERNNMRGANPGDVWQFSHVHYCNENRQNHPTQKPEGLIERMVLASSHEKSVVLDPFVGSGTTLTVCQQLNREGIGIEINPDYADMVHARLREQFSGFDSIDPRLERVPLDMKDEPRRQEYFTNHKKWFLQNHDNALGEFDKNVELVYPENKQKRPNEQLNLLQEISVYESGK